MKFISFILFMLAITVFIASIVLLIKPNLASKWTKSPLSRGKIFLGLVASFALLGFAVEMSPEPVKEKVGGNVAADTAGAKIILASDGLTGLKAKYEKIDNYVKACDAASADIDAVRLSKKPSFDDYYEASGKAYSVCENGWGNVLSGEKFENQDIQKLSDKFGNDAADYLLQKAQFANTFKEAANAGRISPEQKSSLNHRAEKSLKAGITLAGTISEVKKMVGEK